MKIHNECLACIENQAHRVCDSLHVNSFQREMIIQLAQKEIARFDFNLTPPHNATPLYEAISDYLGVEDLYESIKVESLQMAKQFIPLCEERIASSSNALLSAVKTAVAGNVIDLASVMMYDLKEELDKVYQTPFAIDDFIALEKKLQQTTTLVYLADNAGEEIFDKLCINTIKKQFPSLQVYYFVRGRPIINDLTCKDALASKMDDVATIVDSGVPTPGLAIEFMTPYAKSLFESAECIISKGMGNYECLGDIKGLPIFFLFKVKCFVVARDVGAHLGDIICKKGIM